MALRDLAQKGLLSPGCPLLLRPHPIPLLCNLGISLHPFKLETLPYSQKTEAHRRKAAQWRAKEQEHKDTTKPWKTNRHTHKDQHACTLHRHKGHPQCQRLGRTGLGSEPSSSMPWPFSNLAKEGVEMLCAHLPADSKRALGQSDLTLLLGFSGQSLAHPTAWPTCYLWHL